MRINKSFKKIILGALILSFFIPAAFLAMPKKADAGSEGCLGGLITSGISSIFGGASAVMTVPVTDVGNMGNHIMTSASTNGSFINDCIIKPMVEMMAKALIRQFTKSIVNWINSGFEGSPSFVQDPGRFFSQVGDRALGNFVESLGPIGQIVCSPFDLRIRLALGLHYSSTYQDDVGCTLTDIKNNFNNFAAGNFSSSGKGWNNWIQVTNTPNGNPYGSYLNAVSSVDASIVSAQGTELKLLDWGSGFLSYSDCVRYEQVPTETPVMIDGKPTGDRQTTYVNGQCLERGPIKTPGTVIASQLNRTLQSDIVQAELANSIDAIMGALVNQMINQVFSATGLFGASQPDYSGSSYASNMVTTYEGMLEQNRTEIPKAVSATGMDCNIFYANTYTILYNEKAYGQVAIWTESPVGSGINQYVPVENFAGSSNPNLKMNYNAFKDEYGSGPVSSQTGVDKFNQTVTACQNMPLVGAVKTAADTTTENMGGSIDIPTSGGGGGSNPTERNLAVSGSAQQSSLAYSDEGPKNANDYRFDGCSAHDNGDCHSYSGILSRTLVQSPNNPQWWQIDLLNKYSLSKVNIWKPTENVATYNDFGKLCIIISDNQLPDSLEVTRTGDVCTITGNTSNGAVISVIQPVMSSAKNPIDIILPSGTQGRWVRVQTGTDGASVASAEIEVYGIGTPVANPTP